MSSNLTLPIGMIDVGERCRKDLGEIEALARSIEEVGLLHPIVVTPDNRMIAGERRLAAMKLLGRADIPVTVVDIAAIVRGEMAENTVRKDFVPSAAVAIARAVEDEERRLAQERQQASRFGNGGGANLAPPDKGKSRDRVAARAGVARTTLDKARKVVEAAEAQPGKFAAVVADMDKSGNVDRAFKAVQIARERERYAVGIVGGGTVDDLAALAASGYRAGAICPDPPWRFQTYSAKGKQRSPERYYDTMSLDALKAMGPLVQALAAKDSVLLPWVTMPLLPAALELIGAWGFEYKTCAFCLVKTTDDTVGDAEPETHMGGGYWTRANAELCLLATRGNPKRLAMDVRQIVQAPRTPRGEHSTKPDEVYERIRRLVGGPYLELFGRRPRPGWTVWGNENPRPWSTP